MLAFEAAAAMPTRRWKLLREDEDGPRHGRPADDEKEQREGEVVQRHRSSIGAHPAVI